MQVTIENVRLTIPAREAMERDGNRVAPAGETAIGAVLYNVELVRPPAGVELVLIGQGAGQHRGLRRSDEPEYPGEWPSGAGIGWAERGQLVPCPECGAALVWAEAGFVPGWRICLAGHAARLSDDGRAATREPAHDKSTLASTRPL